MRKFVEFSSEVLSDSLAVFWYKLFLIGQLLVLKAYIAYMLILNMSCYY